VSPGIFADRVRAVPRYRDATDHILEKRQVRIHADDGIRATVDGGGRATRGENCARHAIVITHSTAS
jgi:hypothetical protein